MTLDPLFLEAIERFHEVFARASRGGAEEPNAMTLATVDDSGRPGLRVMLLKGADERGFVFYTNCQSRKGADIAANPQVALCMFWPALMEQVRVEGQAVAVTPSEADAYWATRARDSQIGAWASHQSRAAGGPAALEQRIERYQREFQGREVPRPEHWSGYRVSPDWIEFWHGGHYAQRIHRRMCYRLAADGWQVSELDP